MVKYSLNLNYSKHKTINKLNENVKCRLTTVTDLSTKIINK